MIIALCIIIWVLFGFYLAYDRDGKEMKKEVPYGELPSLGTLKYYRVWTYFFCMTIGPPMFVVAKIDRMILGPRKQ